MALGLLWFLVDFLLSFGFGSRVAYAGVPKILLIFVSFLKVNEIIFADEKKIHDVTISFFFFFFVKHEILLCIFGKQQR